MDDTDRSPPSNPVDRRSFLAALGSLSVSGGLFPGVLWAVSRSREEITVEMVEEAEKIAGLAFSPEERRTMVARLHSHRNAFEAIRERSLAPDVAPAFHFDPVPPGATVPVGPSLVRPSAPGPLPSIEREDELAFASLVELGALLRDGVITSVELTRMYLERLHRFGDQLECVVTLTEELAMEQAGEADRELASGLDRGPLHGIPWGAKDLLATRRYPTTWGALPFRNQRFDRDATVVRRLSAAGAVLVAKLSLGALAMGDVWFGGRTRNPWRAEEGASGSSAGSAAATAAGLVGFSIGTETLGSILSPSARCGVTGLRPTFGRVSRDGAMPLAWSMDKIGPICRRAEDCALVLSAIQGPDGLDRSVRDVPFSWDGAGGHAGIRVGVLSSGFDGDGEEAALGRAALETLRGSGVELRPVDLPDDLPISALRFVLDVEAASAFDELTRNDADALLPVQGPGSWPEVFRAARLVPAVEYVQASRIRTLLIADLAERWSGVDVVVAPSREDQAVLATNLTGHPAVAVPYGFRRNGTPASVTVVGGLWKESEALRIARVLERASGGKAPRPPGFS